MKMKELPSLGKWSLFHCSDVVCGDFKYRNNDGLELPYGIGEDENSVEKQLIHPDYSLCRYY